jgi:dihydroorotase-like cyclic amidohydrolase
MTSAPIRDPLADHLLTPENAAVGDYAAGDILIRDGKIAQVGEDLARQAGEAVVIDAAGTSAVPGDC